MSFAATLGAARRKAALSGWKRDAVLGAAVALFALCLHAAAGFPSLAASHGDNDSLLRLVQVRDLLGGQGWYDLHQYRMGPEGGFVMHWSRLVDAPIAAIVLAGAALGADMATGEAVALIAWPLLLLAAAQTFLIRIARTLGNDCATLPALTIGGAALYFVGLFSPGNIDHHNLQLVLTLAAIAALVADGGFRAGLLAGVASALMLAIGMETLPYVAVAGLAAAIAFLAAGQPQAAKATGFGLGFAACGAAAFLATVPPGTWLAAQCDAYSIPQFAIALAAGLGLAVVSGFAPLRETFARRLAGLTTAGVAIVAVAALFFPQCLADPYAGLDPRLQTFWLSAVTEAQPVWSVVAKNQAMAVSYYVTPLLGLIVLGWWLRKRGIGSTGLIVAAFLATAFAVSLWQVRGAMFAIPLAAIPLSAWVGTWRERAASGGGSGSTLGMVLAWLVSLNLVWGASANAVAKALGRPVSPGAEASAATCDRVADFAALAAMPATTVLAISNLGAPILVNTHHSVFAGPYHRNVEGNLIALEAFMGSEQEALAIARTNHVGLVALCRGNDETGALARWAPSGFMAALARGGARGWLEKVPATESKPLELYRVLP